MKKEKLSLKNRILKEIFELAPKRYREEDLDNHILVKKLKITSKELMNNIEFLIEIGLIHRWVVHEGKNRIFEWVITEKGLDYLDKKEGERKQEKFNQIVAFTGTLIALITIYGFIVNATNLENYPTNYWIVTIIFLALVVSCLGPLTIIIFNFWRDLISKNEN